MRLGLPWAIPLTPPRVCLQTLPLDRKLKQLYLISVAQFRPEKNQALQLRAFARARQHAMETPPTPAGTPQGSDTAAGLTIRK